MGSKRGLRGEKLPGFALNDIRRGGFRDGPGDPPHTCALLKQDGFAGLDEAPDLHPVYVYPAGKPLTVKLDLNNVPVLSFRLRVCVLLSPECYILLS